MRGKSTECRLSETEGVISYHEGTFCNQERYDDLMLIEPLYGLWRHQRVGFWTLVADFAFGLLWPILHLDTGGQS